MVFVALSQIFFVLTSILLAICLCLLATLTYFWWILPNHKLQNLKKCGFDGPIPSFPFGNIKEMKRNSSFSFSLDITHNIHSIVSPYYSSWQKSFGKVFIYWLGVEPFLYVADPEFLKKMSGKVMAKKWGKPSVFRKDRKAMFGNGLAMAEGTIWVHHRHVIAPTFTSINLKTMTNMMIDSTKKMIKRWDSQINSGHLELDLEREIVATAGEIIARASFGMNDENGKLVFDQLRTLQMTLFKTDRYVGVPFGKFINFEKTLEAKKIGEQVDKLLLSIIESRMNSNVKKQHEQDFLGHLLKENNEIDGQMNRALTKKELIDECKTLFFGGYETTSLSITWTLLLLALHQDWQDQLRDEIKQVVGNIEKLDINLLADLKKMKWVMNEALRLYPPSPNVQRQTLEDIHIDNVKVPKGTNIWIDVVAMHHDVTLWGNDANKFKPERFMNDANGECNHKMGYLPFGFGGRACVGRNLTFMEYKIVLTLLLSKFKFKLSPSYHHFPTIMLTLRPSHGLPLIVQSL
ncbi:unnamed protein product [Vicia faba]|uniref:Cytochrome P450 n=1 Tax=Vicia faba TaxID=3906 RepID=A0AAV0ZP21_VICFA|nr:unnamed protein product [Vicia faba]